MSNKVNHGADERRPGDAVKGVIMEFAVVLGFTEVGGKMLDHSSTQKLAGKGDIFEGVLLYNCAGCAVCACSNGTILAWKTVGAFRTLVI